MDENFNIPPLSKESIYYIVEFIDRALANLKYIDQALSNLDSPDAFYMAPEFSVNDLFNILGSTLRNAYTTR